jgi:hypothetical protein
MSHLPPLVMKTPRLLYFAAAIFFLWSFGLTIGEINISGGYAMHEGPVLRLALLRGLYEAALEAAYIAANGVIVHVLLAIWARGRAADTRGGEE